MTAEIEIRAMRTGDVAAASALLARSFHGSLASAWPSAAVQEFERYIGADSLELRLKSHHQHWVATAGNGIVGVLELRGERQITLFFVDRSSRGLGIGRKMLDSAEHHVHRSADGHRRALAVHACGPVVPLYVRLGFRPTGERKRGNGLVFVALERKVGQPSLRGSE